MSKNRMLDRKSFQKFSKKIVFFLTNLQLVAIFLFVPIYGVGAIFFYISFATIIVLSFCLNFNKIFKSIKSKITNGFFCYFILGFLLLLFSVFNSTDIKISSNIWLRYFIIIFTAILVYDTISKAKINKEKWLFIFLTVSLIGALVIFAKAFFYEVYFKDDVLSSGTYFWRPRRYTHMLPFFLVFFYLFWDQIKAKKEYIISVSAFIILCLAIASYNFSRTPFLVVSSLLLVLTILHFGKLSTKNKLLVGFAVILMVVMPLLLNFKVQFYASNTFNESYLPTWLIDPHRQLVWKFAFNNLFEMPFFGYGLNRSSSIPGALDVVPWLSDLYWLSGKKKLLMPVSPHNFILEILLDTGLLLGLYLLFGLLIRVIYLIINKNNFYARAELYLHTGNFAVLFVEVFYTDISMPIYVMMLGIVLGLAKNAENHKASKKIP